MVIAFWNIYKKELSDMLVELVNERNVDILLLAECEEDTILKFLIKQKKLNPNKPFYHISTGRIVLLSSYNSSSFEKINTLSKSPRWDVYTVTIPTIIKLNLFCVHFHSKVNWSEDSLALECVILAKDIEMTENSSGVEDSIVIGDFNMNPYENGLVAANGLHALPDLSHIVMKPNGRKIDGINYKYFYNPMWNFFGDNKIPYGTHYFREPGHISREWNIYDQVIYRPALSKYIDNENINIIFNVAGDNLITAMNRPDKNNYSDHLPLSIELTL